MLTTKEFMRVNKEFIADISELEALEPNIVYNGGFELKSTKTGKVAKFIITATVRNNEDELLYWIAQPANSTLKAMPELAGWKAKLFND